MAEQFAVAAQQIDADSAVRRWRTGLEYREVGADSDDGAKYKRKAKYAAPAERIDQNAANHRRDHRADGVGHRQIGDHFDKMLRAIDVLRDSAAKRDAAARSD